MTPKVTIEIPFVVNPADGSIAFINTSDLLLRATRKAQEKIAQCITCGNYFVRSVRNRRFCPACS